MKKKLMLSILLASLVLTFAACGSDTSSDAADDQTNEASMEEDMLEEGETQELNSEEKFASVEEMLENPDVAAELANSLGDLGEDMTMEVRGDGAKLIYSLQLLNMGDADKQAVADAMKQAFAESKDEYVGIANSLRDVLDVPTPVVVIEILDPDKAVLFTELYPAE